MAIIGDKLTFEEFRNRCEDKTALTEKGQLYAATSETVVVNDKTITQTTATPAPSMNSLLVQDLNQASGLNWKHVFDVLSDAQGEWINVADAEIGAENLVKGATYEIMPYREESRYLGCGIITLIGDVLSAVLLGTSIIQQSGDEKILEYSKLQIVQQSDSRVIVTNNVYAIGFNSSMNGIKIVDLREEFLKFKYRRIL